MYTCIHLEKIDHHIICINMSMDNETQRGSPIVPTMQGNFWETASVTNSLYKNLLILIEIMGSGQNFFLDKLGNLKFFSSSKLSTKFAYCDYMSGCVENCKTIQKLHLVVCGSVRIFVFFLETAF